MRSKCAHKSKGRDSEMLCGDLRAIQSALREVLSQAQPQVPSWRFPERLSTAITIDDLLTLSDGGSSDRVNLLEGIVDRQVFSRIKKTEVFTRVL